MTLPPEERRQLHAALVDAFPNDTGLRNLTLLHLGVDLQTITRLDAIPAMALNVISYFEAQDRIADLIRGARTANPGSAALETYGEAILARLAAEAQTTWYTPPADPIEACFIQPGPLPLISRPTLRRFLREIDQPGGFPVLVVNGLSKTGKSYSFQFISYLKRVLGQYQVGWVDLKDEVYAEYKPEHLTHDIAVSLGWDRTTLPQRPSTRYPKELARWMLGQTGRGPNPQPVVVVLDGFHQPELYGETRDFVQELIKQVAANTTPLRLVLLNYADSLLPPGLPPIQREPLTALSRPEIVQFFTSVAQHKGRDAPPAVIQQIVDQVLADIPAGDPAYNELLNEKVKQAAELLLQ